ncbi:pyridoxal phosphate-dependent aminotransferase [Croceicoccus mobilis]|uniref:Aminotransferase n=1 Tax=Croceicoccus mobilis TaxID=1703339 RepID=A0A916YUY9_9SPHN|nr:pyridoxal phosphate-dependent aminotransferase [Croceicoccus mobilis]GGD62695.1 aminotransferase [Croceicoccus mobilis]
MLSEDFIDEIETLAPDAEGDLSDRGFSRRQIGRIAMMLGGSAAMASFGRPAMAQQSAPPVAGAVRIQSNECWTGPFSEGVAAAAMLAKEGNRYEPNGEHAKLFAAVAEVEGIPEDHILAWPGSSDPLNRVVVTFCSPEKGLVTGNPSYEQSWRTSQWLGVPLERVPLTAAYAHDPKAMLAANPNAGLYYVCSPNNPTGTITPLEDIVWLAENKPKDSVLVVDEAYIHFADVPSAAKLAATRDDVIVLRTFSKLFGMAGMRLGLTFASPALHERMMRYDGGQVTNMLPMTAVACGTECLKQTAKIAARKAELTSVRAQTLAHLDARGVKYIPGSQANMFMADWGTLGTPKEIQAKFLEQGVQIGRSWDAMPTMSRITVGSAEDMQKFALALDKILMA